MTWVATGVTLVGGLYAANQGKDAASSAANKMQGATDQSLAENQRQFNISQNNMAPWLRAGRKSLAAQQDLMGLGGDGTQMQALQSAPGYQFRLQQGQRSLDAGLAARGGMGSGKSMQAGVDYNQNFASNEYQNRLNQLAGLSNTGQSTATQMGNQGMQYAQNQGNLWTGNANAQGAAGLQAANMNASTLQGVGNVLGNYYGRK